MKRIIAAAFLIIAISASAQKAKPAAPPAITDAQKAAYWKALSQQQAAQKQLDSASALMNQAVQSMILTCGEHATLQAPNGEPECVAKPETVKAEAPAAKK